MLLYALLILGLSVLLIGFFLYRRNWAIENQDEHYCIWSLRPKGDDPYGNRTEFFCVRRSRNTGS
jgi:hypothetical protein